MRTPEQNPRQSDIGHDNLRASTGEKTMRKTQLAIGLACLAGASLMAAAPATAQTAPAAQAAHYSVSDTLVGTLVDDPAAAAILQKLIPTVWANPMFQDAGRSLTLKAIQQYEPDALSDENLARIQAEFDKLPAKT
jgi:para-nitrobenzyl esterase